MLRGRRAAMFFINQQNQDLLDMLTNADDIRAIGNVCMEGHAH